VSGQRRLGAHLAALAFERIQKRGFLAADIGAGADTDFEIESEIRAANLVAEHGATACRTDGVVHHVDGVRIFRTDIDVSLGRAGRDAGNRHPFDQDEGIAFHDHAVGESAGVAFVGIADNVFLLGPGIGDRLPLDAGRETGAAASAQAGLRDLRDDGGGLRQGLVEAAITAMRAIVFQRARIDDAAAGEGQTRLFLQERMFFGLANA